MDDFDWTEAGVRVETEFLKETAVSISVWFYVVFVVPLTKPQYSISDRLSSRY